MSWTIAELTAGGYTVTAYCGNYRCARNKRGSGLKNGRDLDLARFPPHTLISEIREWLTCEACGTRMGRTIVSPKQPAGSYSHSHRG